MDDLVRFFSDTLPNSAADLLDVLFHMALWQLLTGAVVLTCSIVLLFSVSESFWGRAKIVAVAALALVAIAMFRPFSWGGVFG